MSNDSQPDFDPAKLLGEIKSLLEKKGKPVSDGSGRKSSSWVWALIIPLLVFAGIAAFSWYTMRRNRELAKLRHEKFKAKLKKEGEELFLEVNRNSAMIELAEKRLAKFANDLRIIEADIAAEEKRYEANIAAIDSIRSWGEAGIR